MLLTEAEGKAILREAGIAVPDGIVVSRAADAARIAAFPVAVKAQLRAGGRGLQGGVVRADDADAAARAIERIMALSFVGGARADAVLVEPWLAIEREMYLAVAVDPAASGYAILYSPQGGVAIEQAAPPVRYAVGPPARFRGHELRAVLATVEPDAALRERVITLARRLLQLAAARDFTTVEVNPLVRTAAGELLAADAKIVVDESAAFRSPFIERTVDAGTREEPTFVQEALAHRLMFVWLGGEIGLISGGAGMTMAAMDMIADQGGAPACFLDCSANPTPEGYAAAFRLLDERPEVRVVLVSIFGGGTHMDRVAKVMAKLMAERSSTKPVVFRLNGTQAEGIAPVFAAAGLRNVATLEEAVGLAVGQARGNES